MPGFFYFVSRNDKQQNRLVERLISDCVNFFSSGVCICEIHVRELLCQHNRMYLASHFDLKI